MKIMKVSFVIVSFFLLSFTANAQASVGIGLKGGLNFSKLSVSQSAGSNYNNRTGYHFGAYALIKLGKIGIQPELLYSKQGTNYTVSTQNWEANFDYINVPIIIKLYTVAGINIQVGPQFGFASGGQLKNTATNTTTSYSSFIKSNDISAALGLGWDLPFGLSIDARYNLGLSNNNNSGSTSDVKNQVIMISAGYRLFKLGK